MPYEEVGSLTRTSSECVTVEWTIQNIFSYTSADEYLQSPEFCGFNSSWYLYICPFGEKRTDSVGWISLFLCKKKDATNLKNMKFELSFRKVDGTFEKVVSIKNYDFDDDHEGTGKYKIIEKSELKQRKSELAPFDDLTVSCTVMNNDRLDISRLFTLSENFKDMFVSKKECDITLNVQEEEIPAHKSVLACRCPVFETMFNINMKEKDAGVVEIEDCNPEAFKDFLMYIYSGKFTHSSSDVFELYKIAHKYMVAELKLDCVFYMLRNLSVENVLDSAILAHRFDENELKTKVQEFFNKHFSDISDSTKWDSFLKENYAVSNELLKNMGKSMKTLNKS